jgi:hypothetical protein
MPLKVLRWGAAGYAVFDGNTRLSGEIKDPNEAALRADRLAKKAQRQKRSCLCCAHPFLSEGAHNRLCDRCRNTSDTFDLGIAI